MAKDLEPLVAVVTPVHNQIQHTLDFLASLEKQDYANRLIIIVDDGSTDGSAAIITEKYPGTAVLHGDGTLWWTGSTNLGVEYALKHGARFILTVNNDVRLNSSTINDLVKAAHEVPNSLVGALICYSDNPDRVWYAGGFFDKSQGQLAHRQGRRTDYHGIVPADWLTGMGMLVPSEVFGKIGSFDKLFPQYFADADFSLRAKRAGFSLYVDADTIIYADIHSSWLNKQKKTGRLKFLPTLLFSFRSPFSLRLRYVFYKRHWGKGYRRAWLKLYLLYFWRLAYRYRDTMEHI